MLHNNLLHRKVFSVLLLLYSLAVFVFIAFIKKPDEYGDGFEYIYMAESFIQHKTPDLQENDVKIAQKHLSEQNPHILISPDVYHGYYESNSGKYYSYHFWLYPLIVSPIQQILRFFNANELKAFGITNALMYIFMLWFVYLSADKKKRLILTILMSFSPLVPYVTWTHTEVFSATLITISLICYYNKNLQPAILFSALAACQNPPIVFFTIWLGLVYIYNTFKNYQKTHRIDWRNFVITGLCGLPLIFSPLFYYINFSTFNLIQKVGAASFDEIYFNKFISYFFDLNQGAIIYSGLLLIFFLGCIVKNICFRNFKNFDLVICLILMAVLSLTTHNWNCGMSAVIRYFVWTYPLMVFYVVYSVDFHKKKWWAILLCLNMLVLCVVHGGFSGVELHLYHNRLVREIFARYPRLYNPEHQIFVRRTEHKELWPYQYPHVYSDKNGHAKKVLTDLNGWLSVKDNDNYEINDQKFYDKKLALLKQNPDKAIYINVNKDEIIVKSKLIEFDDKLVFSEINDDIIGLARHEDWGRWSKAREVKFRLKSNRFKNISNSPYVVLNFDVRPFINKMHPMLKVEIYANGHYLAVWKFENDKPMPVTNLYMPKELINGDKIDFTFIIDNPRSPSSLGIGSDTRALGIGFIAVEIDKM